MHRLFKAAPAVAVNAAQLAGAAAVADAVWRVYMPAGLFVAGVLAIALSLLVERKLA